MNGIYLLNVLSRWILLGVASYKAYRERSMGWVLLSMAFLLAAVDPERVLLEPLGLKLDPEVSRVLDLVGTALEGTLLIVAGGYINPTGSPLQNTAIGLFLGVLAYIWIVVTSVVGSGVGFTVRTFFPSLLYAGSYIYVGMLLYRYVVSRGVQLLLPAGMVLLGILNATYPITARWEWFLPYGFLMGTLFRIAMAIGALDFAFWPLLVSSVRTFPPYSPVVSVFPTFEDFLEHIGDLRRIPNLLLVTRRDVGSLKSVLHPNALVFWVTRVKEGDISDSPRIYAISPTKIDILTHLIAGAVDRNYNFVVIDGVEYLILENGFERTLKFLLNIKDRVLLRGGRMVLIVDPDALERHQWRIIEAEFRGRGLTRGPFSR
ncbi:DUF835 domain-containing protein [Thermococcus sp.]|uniref:DUF835 domain-containing protein n=1 Tax=Thermococcus sp. TaxID=35749 RepID=UPI00262F1229|nr:DUF835 domain-containing protein [Thermococcus sp.]